MCILPCLLALLLSTVRDLVGDILVSFRSSRDFCSTAAFVVVDVAFLVVLGDDVVVLSFSFVVDREGAVGELFTDVELVVLFLGVAALLPLPLPLLRETDR